MSGRFPRLAVTSLLLVFIASVAVRRGLYPRYNVNDDAGAYIFGAETIALGRLSVPVPKPAAAFETWMVVQDAERDRMYTRYTLGFPLALFLGRLVFGSYEIIPPLALTAAAFILWRTGRRVAAVPGDAAWIPLFLATSPFFLLNGSMLLTHGTCLLCFAAALFAYVRAEECDSGTRAWAFAFLCGSAVGFAMAVRPFSGFLLALTLLVHRCAESLPDLRKGGLGALVWKRWTGVLVGAALFVAALLAANAATTGGALHFPFHDYWPRDTIGFLPDRGVDDPDAPTRVDHTPWRAVAISALNYIAFEHHLHLLPGVFLVISVATALMGDRLTRHWKLMLLLMWIPALGYGYHHARGWQQFGPVYWFETLAPVAVCGGLLLPRLVETIRARPTGAPIAAVLVLLFAATAQVGVAHMEDIEDQLHVNRLRYVTEEMIERGVPPEERAVVFLPAAQRGSALARTRHVGHLYGHLRNDPLLRNRIIYAVAPSPAVADEAIRMHDDRVPYHLLVVHAGRIRRPDGYVCGLYRRKRLILSWSTESGWNDVDPEP